MLNKKNIKIWIAIAKKEFRINTYRFRGKRKLILILIFGTLSFWGFYLGPIFLNAIIPEILKAIGPNYVKQYFLDLIGYFFFILFIYNFLVPIYDFYRKPDIDIKETYLSSPIKINDVVMAEFLWRIPFYIIVVLILGPLLVILLNIVKDVQIIDYFILYFYLFLLFVFSLLLGLIVISIIKYNAFKIRKIQKNAIYFIFFLTFIVILIVYILQFLVIQFASTDEYNVFLILIPSYWFSNIVAYVVDPSSLTFSEISISIILSITIPILVLYLYYRSVNNSFISEKKYNNNFSESTKSNTMIYKVIDKLTVKKWKSLVMVQSKEYLRDKENIAKILFTLSMIILTGFALFFSFPDLKRSLEDSPFSEFIQITINSNQYKILVIILLSWTGSFFYVILNATYPFLNTKDIIFYYRKSPRGFKSLIISYIYSQILILLFIDIIITLIFSLLFFLDILLILLLFLYFLFNNIILLLLGIGLQCYNPLFKDEKKIVFINVYYILIIQMISLFIVVNLLLFYLSKSDIHFNLIVLIFLSNLLILIIPMFILLFFGIKRIKKLY